ncbi:MAG: hypothetical protein DRJ64_01665 [Thermoprotei archaeon]|nr:MAG: hypothetical protein DRJ64_01665 [Thermoprotei archaeon]
MKIMSIELFEFEKRFREYMNSTYWCKNDIAHQMNHGDGVWMNFCYLVNTNHVYGLDRTICFIGVYMHDMYCSLNRETHNELASEFILNIANTKDKQLALVRDLPQKDIELIAEMVYWHRSSLEFNVKKFDNELGTYIKVMRAADKGKPDFKSWVERSMKYHEGSENQIENVKKHFIEKFSEDGYAWKNDSNYKELYKKDYEIFQKELKEWLKSV